MKQKRFTSLEAIRMSLAIYVGSLLTLSAGAQTLGNHPAVYDQRGNLMPWTSWHDALEREVNWYLKCPVTNGYPNFVVMTFMRDDYQPRLDRPDFIPATQNGMGIISYLKYHAWTGRTNPELITIARAMGDYLVKEALTPDEGKYPRFPRSTGIRLKFPQPPDCGSQADQHDEIQPDKGGIAAYALVLLYKETKDERYLNQALHTARVLVTNMVEGADQKSPWPFRADYRTGEGRGDVGSNQSFTHRLFNELADLGYREFRSPREKLWAWIKNYQIPNAAKDGRLWAQFFEDYDVTTNRNSWAAMNTVRYLCEEQDSLDPDWQQDARVLITFVNKNFTSIWSGVLVCGEQDVDTKPWGGAVSTYGAGLAMYARATGSDEFKGLAWQAMNYALYSIDFDGCPSEAVWKGKRRGGWQEDAHTDKLHNFVDAMTAFPEWAK
ncbi:MAG: hypothetical protein IT579_23625 [Verrucomicrobia subdivision 3 bacterium]|nr:hypothetical protein [Limisphaerales bacterium]